MRATIARCTHGETSRKPATASDSRSDETPYGVILGSSTLPLSAQSNAPTSRRRFVTLLERLADRWRRHPAATRTRPRKASLGVRPSPSPLASLATGSDRGTVAGPSPRSLCSLLVLIEGPWPVPLPVVAKPHRGPLTPCPPRSRRWLSVTDHCRILERQADSWRRHPVGGRARPPYGVVLGSSTLPLSASFSFFFLRSHWRDKPKDGDGIRLESGRDPEWVFLGSSTLPLSDL